MDVRRRRVPTGSTATLASLYDINRDGKVNALDVAALRANLTRVLRPVTSVGAAALSAPAPLPPAPQAPAGSTTRRLWDELPPQSR